jgi:hypothetical protein
LRVKLGGIGVQIVNQQIKNSAVIAQIGNEYSNRLMRGYYLAFVKEDV